MSKKYVLAVSGGVDSVVLLDMVTKQAKNEVIVAHFDHGIRDDSSQDADFVKLLAKKYNVKYVSKREVLGKDASEELARNRRYKFLRNVAKRNDATIMTGHHRGDVIETIALNFERSTGWRGLAVMDTSDILRPLLKLTKDDIYEYALKNNLEWFEDKTNLDKRYHRNRLEDLIIILKKHPYNRNYDYNIDLQSLHNVKYELEKLRNEQVVLKNKIDSEVESIIKLNDVSLRHFMIMIDQSSALEILRSITSAKLTRPQMKRVIHRIKIAKPGTKYQAGAGVVVSFTKTHYKVDI